MWAQLHQMVGSGERGRRAEKQMIRWSYKQRKRWIIQHQKARSRVLIGTAVIIDNAGVQAVSGEKCNYTGDVAVGIRKENELLMRPR